MLTCDLKNATWFHNPFYSSKKYKLKVGSKLALRKIKYSDIGIFVCHGIREDYRMIIDKLSIVVYG